MDARWSRPTPHTRRDLLASVGAVFTPFGTPAALRLQQSSTFPRTGVFIEPEDGRTPLLDEIAAARSMITVHIYLLTDDTIRFALREAVDRGIAVRVLLEEHPFGGPGDQPETFTWLAENGIDVRWSDPRFAYSHVKTMTVDATVALIMNLNLTEAAFTRNREIGIVTTDRVLVDEAIALFEADWNRGAEPAPGPLVVSPQDARRTVLSLVSTATATLDLYLEVLRDETVIANLIDAAARGVGVRAVLSPGDGVGEETLATLLDHGIDVRWVTDLYVHAKLLLADGTAAMVGSQNLTTGSLDANREIGVLLTDEISLTRVAEVFDHDFRYGQPISL